jgi:hypothetical protein
MYYKIFSIVNHILIEDFPLCFNSHNKTNSLLRQNTTILYNYWYFVMATYFGLSTQIK